VIITIKGTPQVWPKKLITAWGKGGVPLDRPQLYMRDKDGKFKAYRESFAIQVRQQFKGAIIPPEIPLAMGAIFYIPQPPSVKREFMTVAPDEDNYRYCVANLLKGLVYFDDRSIVEDLGGGKVYTKEKEGWTIITIQKVKGTTEELISDIRKHWGE
jgi:Holliday junction resolvase RusA-like endonuclease